MDAFRKGPDLFRVQTRSGQMHTLQQHSIRHATKHVDTLFELPVCFSIRKIDGGHSIATRSGKHHYTYIVVCDWVFLLRDPVIPVASKPWSPLARALRCHFYKRKETLNILSARAVHETAIPFDLLDHPAWQRLFAKIRPAWKLPSPSLLGGELLSTIYEENIQETLHKIKSDCGGVLGVDGATNVMSKSLSNVNVHTPLPFFIEYLRSDLGRETTCNVFARTGDCMMRLDQNIGFKCCYSFISDSCNGMRDVRKELLSKKLFKWVYECCTHCLHNLSEDLGSKLSVSGTMKKALFISKTIKSTGLL